MKEQDRDAIAKQCENSEFNELYNELIALSLRIRQELNITRVTPTRKEVREGAPVPIILTRKKGHDIPKDLILARDFHLQAESLARSLSKFFPESKREYWQELFITLAFSGHASIEQAQRGGRKKQVGIPPKTAERYKQIAEDYWSWDKRGGTQEQFVKKHGISKTTLHTAIKFAMENE